MTSSLPTVANVVPLPGRRLDAVSVLSIGRSLVGAGTWLSPAGAWRIFGLGSQPIDASAGLVGRLFGVRDLVLGQAVRHPNPDVRRAALQIGVAADSMDVVASLLALRRGAPKGILLSTTAGAALFVALGLAALSQTDEPLLAGLTPEG